MAVLHGSCQEAKRVEHLSARLSNEDLRSVILSRGEPLVFHGVIVRWSCSQWTPQFLARRLGKLETRFRISLRQDSPFYKYPRSKTIMETDCEFVRGTFENFCSWLRGDENTAGALAQFPRAHYWCYADYKYMADLFNGFPDLCQAPDWSKFGFPGRTGEQSTIWIGSDGANTPCHLDTYGCNLVAQIHGKKKWILFPSSETHKLYPTRIPYEESSIFSQVNVACPNLVDFPLLQTAVRYEVILEPGDVLLVPKHWWHFVECVETSISINTWIELETDKEDRVREAITRTLLCSMKAAAGEDPKQWLNPTEKLGSHRENMEYIQQAVTAALQDKSTVHSASKEQIHTANTLVSADDVISCITSPGIVCAITEQLLAKVRNKQLPYRHNLGAEDTASRAFSRTELARMTIQNRLTPLEHMEDNSPGKEASQNSCDCCVKEGQQMCTRRTKRSLQSLSVNSHVHSTQCWRSPTGKKKKKN